MKSVHERFIDTLKESAYAGEVTTDSSQLDRYSCDESIFSITPQVVVFPRSPQDVCELVRCVQHTQNSHSPLHLTPRAAGTGLSGGSLNDSVVVDMIKYFNKIHSHSKQDNGDVLYTIDPGVYYRDLEVLMDTHGVYIPSFPASKDICTIGGMVGNNAAGPDTLKYGHTAEFVESMKVVLHDGVEYSLRKLEWNDFEREMKRDDALGALYRSVWEELLHHEAFILDSRPNTRKNSAGYGIWDVVSTTVEEFMKGRGTFDLGRLFSGSQGTLGIITQLVIRAVPQNKNTHLVAIPIFDLPQAGSMITNILENEPINVELFDDSTFRLALSRPGFFRQRLQGKKLWNMWWSMYWTYLVRFKKHVPEFTILATFAGEKTDYDKLVTVCSVLNKEHHCGAWVINKKPEKEMLWQIRRASYMLSKYGSATKRPAAFLEDMTVEPEYIGPFFADIKKLFEKHKVEACIHGHGGNGHLHFYPLLDFTLPETAQKILDMSEDFFAAATKYDGNICGEHNDGIIRTPYLDMIFDTQTIEMFERIEHAFDPHDIFNPGKKVNPRFDISKVIRHKN